MDLAPWFLVIIHSWRPVCSFLFAVPRKVASCPATLHLTVSVPVEAPMISSLWAPSNAETSTEVAVQERDARSGDPVKPAEPVPAPAVEKRSRVFLLFRQSRAEHLTHLLCLSCSGHEACSPLIISDQVVSHRLSKLPMAVVNDSPTVSCCSESDATLNNDLPHLAHLEHEHLSSPGPTSILNENDDNYGLFTILQKQHLPTWNSPGPRLLHDQAIQFPEISDDRQRHQVTRSLHRNLQDNVKRINPSRPFKRRSFPDRQLRKTGIFQQSTPTSDK
ncbi:hypothetical protein TNIN_473191 [Trichonephila inaurata madagascariensis]|uniref:Uncharacterized protein n=1 Tax=Trichonephila inaurata madagascariensis TaxID=2747483 RepID=A0A8X6J5Z9_9ARAC|nr:hypothetical protein TNIN_473191 [Trichonephila inaurata madagascariensis]